MKTDLIQVVNNESFTTSLLVAEKFNKNHKDVTRKIETLMSDIEIGVKSRLSHIFKKSEYTDSLNRKKPMYYINRDGFTLLAMGFTGKEALEWKIKYIEAFNSMEEKLRNSSPMLQDNRLELAHLISKLPDNKIRFITAMYPEYFSRESDPDSLEYISDINTSYQTWIDTLNITREWIGNFPTKDIYDNYLRFCHNYNLMSMGKKIFYRIIEEDFGVVKRQLSDGYRYFMTA